VQGRFIVPKKFLELDLGNRSDQGRGSLRQAIPSLLDELRSTKGGRELERDERRWVSTALAVAEEKLSPRPEFDGSYLESLRSWLRRGDSLTAKQIQALNRIVKGFGIDEEVRRRFEKRTTRIIRV